MRTHGRQSTAAQSGFSMVELLISMMVMMTVTAGVFSLMNPATGSFSTQPEMADLTSRLRVGADRIQRDLEVAGSGNYAASKFAAISATAGAPYSGGAKAGSLKFYMPSIFPLRMGLFKKDGTAGHDAPTDLRDDTVTIIGVPVTRTQTAIWFGNGMLSTSDPLTVAWSTGCPMNSPACGFTDGERAIVYDDNSYLDLFTVGHASDNGCNPGPCGNFTTASVTHIPASLGFTYFQQSQVAGIQANTYYLDTATNKVMHNDGFSPTDDVVMDDVVKLKFEYLGEAAPPQIIVEPSNFTPVVVFGVSGGSFTTYGPVPPAIGNVGNGCFANPPGTAPNCLAGPTAFPYWLPGDNCIFEVSGGKHVPRTHMADGTSPGPAMITLPGGSDMVPLSTAGTLFTDGPWCPNQDAPNRFDADMLRIRKVRVMLRLQSPITALRGPAGPLFTNGGTATGPKMVPDQEIRFDVTPRNLNFGR